MFDDDCIYCMQNPTTDPNMPELKCMYHAATDKKDAVYCVGIMNCRYYAPKDKVGVAPYKPEDFKDYYDPVSKPSHYTEGRKYEPKDVIRDWELNFNLGNTVKYVARAGRKDDILQDLKKARQYLDFEIEYLEKEREEK